MATTSMVKLTCKLNNGSVSIINLPAPINNTLTDEDSGETLYDKAFDAIAAVFETDGGATIRSITYEIVKTTVTSIAEDVTSGA